MEDKKMIEIMKCHGCNTEITPYNVERNASLRGFECSKCHKIAIFYIELSINGLAKNFFARYDLRGE